MRNQETDLSFAEFGDTKRPYTAPRNETELEEVANYLKGMARREGLEPPTLRFEAGFAQFQKAPETRDFGHLAHIA